MKTRILTALFALLAVAHAQQPAGPPAPAEPKTKLEQFQAKTGSVIIMGSGDVGSITGKFKTAVSVETREFTDAATGKKEAGVYITVKEGGPPARDQSSFIDLDEIESLIKGIAYIAGLNKSVTKLPRFQATYRTRGDLSMSTYGKDDDVGAAVKSGRGYSVTAYVTVADLGEMRKQLQAALTTLGALKGP